MPDESAIFRVRTHIEVGSLSGTVAKGMNVNIFADSRRRSSLVVAFKSNNSAGHYDPRSQIITLESIEARDFQSLSTASDDVQKRFAGLVIHEFTHWIDHVSTVWGQRNLLRWFKGMAAARAKVEHRFPEILDARLALKTLKYASYYSTSELADKAKASASTPWSYRFSVGQALDSVGLPNPNHPILFTRFATYAGDSVGRVPMSVGALLELNAIAADLFFDFQKGIEASDPVAKAIIERELERKYHLLLYSAETVEYSVAVHCLANSIRGLGIFEAYTRGARLSEIALNLTSDLFASLREPSQSGLPPGFHERFVRKCDIGYAYWCLSQHARDVGELRADEWREAVLQRSGLPTVRVLTDRAIVEMETLRGEIPQFDFIGRRLSELTSYGRSVFTKHGLSRIRNIYQIHHEAHRDGFAPFIFLGDGTMIGESGSWQSPAQAQAEEWFMTAWDFDAWSESFESACLPVLDAGKFRA